MDANIEQQVRERAFQLWEHDAVKSGSAVDYWFAAESEVKAKLMAASPAAQAAAAKPKRTRAAKTTAKITAKTTKTTKAKK